MTFRQFVLCARMLCCFVTAVITMIFFKAEVDRGGEARGCNLFGAVSLDLRSRLHAFHVVRRFAADPGDTKEVLEKSILQGV